MCQTIASCFVQFASKHSRFNLVCVHRKSLQMNKTNKTQSLRLGFLLLHFVHFIVSSREMQSQYSVGEIKLLHTTKRKKEAEQKIGKETGVHHVVLLQSKE